MDRGFFSTLIPYKFIKVLEYAIRFAIMCLINSRNLFYVIKIRKSGDEIGRNIQGRLQKIDV